MARRKGHKPNNRGVRPGTVRGPYAPKVEAAAPPVAETVRGNETEEPLSLPEAPAPEQVMQETPPAAPLTSAPSSRIVSLNGAAILLNVDRATMERWIKREGGDVAVNRTGGLGRGNEWQIDLSKLWAWWGEHCAKKALADAGLDVVLSPRSKLDLLKLAKEAQLVTPNVVVEDLLTRVMSEIRQALTALPGRITREMQGFPVERVRGWKGLAQGVVRETLDGMRESIGKLDLSRSEHVTIEDDHVADAQAQ